MQHRRVSRIARLVAAIRCWCILVLVACAPAAGGDPPLTATLVASGFNQPLYVTHVPDDDSRIFVVEQPGRIRIVDITQDPPTTLSPPFLNIQQRVMTAGSEQGLLGLAFHPDFQQNGYFYVNYTTSGDTTRISRFEVPSETPNEADEASELILLTIEQPQSNHNGGWMEFGLDGYLYIATGDGGGTADDDEGHTDATGNAQDITNNLLGKILRIDVDGTNGATGNYGIPADNPFVGASGDDEIWAYGLRNPWRNSFDPVTGDLYIADVGQADWEEIDFAPGDSPGGENWGWRCREGAHGFPPYAADCDAVTALDPIYDYAHLGGGPLRCSITGGEVYRGCAIPQLSGTYFFADFCSHEIWSFRYDGVVSEFQDRTAELASSGASISFITSFGRDARGEIYICVQSGHVFKIVADGTPSQCDIPVPAMSTVGLLIFVGGVLVAAGIVIRRRHAALSFG